MKTYRKEEDKFIKEYENYNYTTEFLPKDISIKMKEFSKNQQNYKTASDEMLNFKTSSDEINSILDFWRLKSRYWQGMLKLL